MNAVPLVTLLTPAGVDSEIPEPALRTLQLLGAAFRTLCYPPDELAAHVARSEQEGSALLIVFGKPEQLQQLTRATVALPILTVPLLDPPRPNLDTLRSAMPTADLPIGSLALGKAGAVNAALLAVAILGRSDPALAAALHRYRFEQTSKVLNHPDPRRAP